MKLNYSIFLLFFLLCGKLSAQNDTIEYKIELTNVSSVPMITVNSIFRGSETGITRLYYPNEFWGQEEMFNVFEGISAQNKGASVTIFRDSSLILVRHKPRELIHLKYSIRQDFKDTIWNELYYRPIIQPGYFHIFGSCLFVVPYEYIENSDKKAVFLIRWQNMPGTGWVIHNSFGSRKEVQIINETAGRFLNSIFVGGDFRIYTAMIEGKPFYFAVRGNWVNLNDDDLFEVLKETVWSQRSFWNDFSCDYFTVTLIPVYADDESLSLSGEGLTNSFSCYFGNSKQLKNDFVVAYMFNHELMHQWIGHTIVTAEEEPYYWFKEGFTDYFAYKNMLRTGLIDPVTYQKETNRSFIKLLYASPVKEQPNDSITKSNFWKNRDYRQLPYKRGYVFALYLDMRIKRATGNEYGLSNVMKDILAVSETTAAGLTNEMFKNAVKRYLPEGIDSELEKYIMEGKLIEFTKDEIPEYISLNGSKEMPEFEFDKSVELMEKWAK
jgi:predicted metalloprotease with PDZ domain